MSRKTAKAVDRDEVDCMVKLAADFERQMEQMGCHVSDVRVVEGNPYGDIQNPAYTLIYKYDNTNYYIPVEYHEEGGGIFTHSEKVMTVTVPDSSTHKYMSSNNEGDMINSVTDDI